MVVYKQNLHILLPVKKYEELRELGHKMNVSRSELAREAIYKLLRSHRRKDKVEAQNVA
jgi:metal-responsive CopG/Arc/MetJ family transcriptional regulator